MGKDILGICNLERSVSCYFCLSRLLVVDFHQLGGGNTNLDKMKSRAEQISRGQDILRGATRARSSDDLAVLNGYCIDRNCGNLLREGYVHSRQQFKHGHDRISHLPWRANSLGPMSPGFLCIRLRWEKPKAFATISSFCVLKVRLEGATPALRIQW